MKKILIFITLVAMFSGCEETEYPYVLPERYFPAYPESYWVYSNGTAVKVDPGYHKHLYYPDLGSIKQSDYVYVPRINNEYVYKYKITQNSTLFPLKILLAPTSSTAWKVDVWNGKNVMRRIENNNASVTLSSLDGAGAIVFDSVVLVVEYIADSVDLPWLYREAYALDIGLIRREINLSDTAIEPFVEKELIRYYINK
ncbi:MAG: membrane lipoprotein lipid attachment site-containing protein [Salinivirgaceae bacterium]|nr:membrane lipoprotein lipid attachment site-containing protein [Salinivirgaceae bacterium]MDY0281389.1 membrane lipoprotein lipid attachment site-containing protein [Salinivirgaceae bacterium]